MRVVGLMSGTSFDGIDAAAADLRLDGDVLHLTPRGQVHVDYDPDVRQAIATALPPAPTTMEAVCRLDTAVGQAFADTARRAVEELCDGTADLVVSHGQTVFHWVEGRTVHGTLQLGQPAWIAEATGLPVVADVRVRDVAAGGQGAPLVSLMDVLLLGRRPSESRAMLNLGGIGNLTVVRPDADPVAFDTGPANALLDAAVTRITEGRETHDVDGARAAAGQVDEALLDRLLEDPYYRLEPPKTTGKEHFHGAYLDEVLASVGPVADDDLVATLTALTARTIADAVVPFKVVDVTAAGGGTRNPTLMRMLDDALGPARLGRIEDLGLAAEAKEAYAFAVLGFLTVHGLPGTVASCTGARHASQLGAILPGALGLPRVTPAPHAPTQLVIHGGAA